MNLFLISNHTYHTFDIRDFDIGSFDLRSFDIRDPYEKVPIHHQI